MVKPVIATVVPAAHPAAPSPVRSGAVRMFGRLQLLRLLGKSERSMAWLVLDAGSPGSPPHARAGQELMLVLPRVQPASDEALQHWRITLRQASRLVHPELAPVAEVGVQDGWPYAAYELHDAVPLTDRLTRQGLAGPEAARIVVDTLRGLAYAHEAGMAHHDLQPHLLLVTGDGALRVAGLAVATQMTAQTETPLDQQRNAAERDVLAAGVLLHGLIAGQPALDEPDIGQVMARLPPQGREIVRLPWTLLQPVADPLRAIVNRATDRQERQRYRNARTLLRALEGWLQTADSEGGGPLALLADKLRAAGVLPASPGAAERAARLALMEGQRTNELAEVVLEDLALSFDLLRLVNSAQVRGVQVSGAGPVLTVRRAIAMLGLEGVRRAALALRPWPGPLGEAGAQALHAQMQRAKRAARMAMALRPAGYDGEVVYLIALMQNLGRLVVQYHFPEEVQQIRRLMQTGPPPRAGEPDEPGMSEEGASFAVLGADVEAIGAAVARLWGLGDEVLGMIRRHAQATSVHLPDGDDDLLRASASCANEALDALDLPPQRIGATLQRVVQRYGRTLNIGLRDLQAALSETPATSASAAQARPRAQVGAETSARISSSTAPAPLDALEPALPQVPPPASRLRSKAASRSNP